MAELLTSAWLVLDDATSSLNATLSSSSSGGAGDDPDTAAARRLLSLLYFSLSLFSLLLSLTVILSYLTFPTLRQHPNSFVFWRSLCDVLYSLQFIVFFAIQPASARPSFCLYFTPLFHFSLLASQSFYFTLSLDLLISLRNPFLSLSSSPLYYLYSFSIALLTALLIPLTHSEGYRAGMEICWIKASQTTSLNVVTWALFFVPTLLYYAFALLVLLYATSRLRAGLRSTFRTREAVLQDAVRYVVAFSAYWTVAGAIYLAIWAHERDGIDLKTSFPLYAAFAVTIGLRAVLDECAWLYSNAVLAVVRRWWKGEKEVQVPSRDINRALRREVLIFTTRGIVLAAEEQTRWEEKRGIAQPSLPKPSHYPKSLSCSAPLCARHLLLRQLSADPSVLSSFPAAAPSAAYSTPFTDYAPHVFSYLRSLWGLSTPSYLASIMGDTAAMVSLPHTATAHSPHPLSQSTDPLLDRPPPPDCVPRQMEKYTEGRSAAFFYYSEDGRFIVKTLTHSEARLLLRILPSYVSHMAHNPHSLLCRVVGLHEVRMYSLRLRFVVMQSVFLSPLLIHERYDIKGSTVDRHTGRVGRKKGLVLKDLDLLDSLLLEHQDRQLFVAQCKEDSRWLMERGIMDYSLLLGIHNTRHRVGASTDVELLLAPSTPSQSLPCPLPPESLTRFQRDAGGLRATVITGPSQYFFGIIDILQEYTVSKRLERCWKVWVRRKPADGVSVMEPKAYRRRFIRAMESITEEQNDQAVAWGEAPSSATPVRRIDVEEEEEWEEEEEGNVSANGGTQGRKVSGGGEVHVGMLKEALMRAEDRKEAASSVVRDVISAEVISNDLSEEEEEELEEDEEEDEKG